MRDFKGMKRQRGRNRKPGGGSSSGGNANATNPNRSWDSQGPENIKVRGNAQTVYERYMQLARDASAAGDRVLAENYTQHAEHYFRVLRALQPSRPVSEIAQRELAGQGFDIDFEDETGAQAAAIMAAEKVEADRLAQIEARQREAEDRQNDRANDRANDRPNDRPNDRQGEQPRREWRDRDEPRQDREPREPRPENDGGFNADGSRRETRRERWERRQQERNARFEREGGEPRPEGEAPAAETVEAAPEVGAERPERAERPARAERPERKPRRDAGVATDDGPSALPGFLTRSTAPAPAAAPDVVEAAATDEAPAPKRRAPRRKAEAPVED